MFFVIVMQGCGALLWLSSWLDIITNWAIGNYVTLELLVILILKQVLESTCKLI